ncbi:hypothetical protein J2X84_004546 [Pseudomonas corrugata]|uniref:hypothetical protein n=1 Tax=Pseudomonas corrugata TaxID=47879 RepID=UPI002860C69B|nr:hypothetical protein [Pseudomonas corrugata]MDR7285696.1 hypothetical protein [Pseudomonas corrugata]
MDSLLLKRVLVLLVLVSAILGALYMASGVRVKASLHGDGGAGDSCSPGYPIAISISNYTLSRVASVTVTLEGWRNGNSNNILSGKDFSFPFVLRALETKVGCYSDEAFSVVESASISTPNAEGYARISTADLISEVKKVLALTKDVELVVVRIDVVKK